VLLSYTTLLIKEFLSLHMQVISANLQKILSALMDWIEIASFGITDL